jgi:biofilm PGA synthesis lipoprotein PgaB
LRRYLHVITFSVSDHKKFIGSCIRCSDIYATFAASPKIDASTLTVIGYHEIIDRKDALIPSYAVTAQQFSEHIDWLKKNGYHFINVDQLLKAHQGKYKLPNKPVLLTVDDGYQSFYQNAYPIIRAKKIPVVLAVVGSWLEPKENQKVDFGGEEIARNKILSWMNLRKCKVVA